MSQHVSDLWSKSSMKIFGHISEEPVWHYTSNVPPSWFFPQCTYFCIFPVCVYITVYLIVHSVTAPGQTKPFRSMFTPKLEATEAVSLQTSLSDYWWYLQCNPILATVGSGFMYWLTCVTREGERSLPRFLFTEDERKDCPMHVQLASIERPHVLCSRGTSNHSGYAPYQYWHAKNL